MEAQAYDIQQNKSSSLIERIERLHGEFEKLNTRQRQIADRMLGEEDSIPEDKPEKDVVKEGGWIGKIDFLIYLLEDISKKMDDNISRLERV